MAKSVRTVSPFRRARVSIAAATALVFGGTAATVVTTQPVGASNDYTSTTVEHETSTTASPETTAPETTLAPSTTAAPETTHPEQTTTTVHYEMACEELDDLLAVGGHDVRPVPEGDGVLLYIDQEAYDYLYRALTVNAQPGFEMTSIQAKQKIANCGFCLEVPQQTTTTHPETTLPPQTTSTTTTTEPPSTTTSTTTTTEAPTTTSTTTTTVPVDVCPDLDKLLADAGFDPDEREVEDGIIYDIDQEAYDFLLEELQKQGLSELEAKKTIADCGFCLVEVPEQTTTTTSTTIAPTTTTEAPTTTTEAPVTTAAPTTEAPTTTAAPVVVEAAPPADQLAWTGANTLAVVGTGAGAVAGGAALLGGPAALAALKSRRSSNVEAPAQQNVAGAEPPKKADIDAQVQSFDADKAIAEINAAEAAKTAIHVEGNNRVAEMKGYNVPDALLPKSLRVNQSQTKPAKLVNPFAGFVAPKGSAAVDPRSANPFQKAIEVITRPAMTR